MADLQTGVHPHAGFYQFFAILLLVLLFFAVLSLTSVK
jgi:hypothetical protein